MQEIADRLGSTRSTVQRHLYEIGKVHRQDICVPYLLNDMNKEQRQAVCTSLLTRQQNKSFFNRIITGNKKWM